MLTCFYCTLVLLVSLLLRVLGQERSALPELPAGVISVISRGPEIHMSLPMLFYHQKGLTVTPALFRLIFISFFPSLLSFFLSFFLPLTVSVGDWTGDDVVLGF